MHSATFHTLLCSLHPSNPDRQTDKPEQNRTNIPPNQITKLLSLALALAIPSITLAATSDETAHLKTNTNTDLNTTTNSELAKTTTTTTLTLTAYEFPFCLASDSDYLQNFFISRPTHTNLTLTLPPSFSAPNGECMPINASKGIPHSFYYTVYNNDDDGGSKNDSAKGSDFGSCELVTFEKEGCEGEETKYSLRVEGEDEDEGGQSECFSRPDRFVKALLRSARIECS
jgi:hypothetical protein